MTAAAAAGTMAADHLLLPEGLFAVRTPAKWDQETDVVVVGSGYAGLAAALEAFDAGSKVIVIEKQPIAGGNSIIANGNYNAVDPERQKKQGIEDSTDLFYKQAMAYGNNLADPEKLRFLVDNATPGLLWLEKMGVQFNPTVVGMPPTPRTHPPAKNGRGAAIVAALKAQVEKRKIPIMLEYKLTGVVREKPHAGTVQGVEVEHRGKKLYFKAAKATVLATGGFGADVKLRSKYVHQMDADVPTVDQPGATGEAIVAAEQEGAVVVNMKFIETTLCNFKTKKPGSLVNSGKDSAVFVNLGGKRFVAEDAKPAPLADAVIRQPKKMMLWVADDRCAKAGNEAATAGLLKENLCFKVDKLDDLAKVLQKEFGVPPDKFLATIKQYNESAAKGEDKHGKAKAGLKPVEKAPFYASPVVPATIHTLGGLKTKGNTAQVLDKSGNPIPRLYAAGEVSGGTHGDARIGGNGTAAAVVFGRLSGQRAAAEKPWA
ncbi:MAG: flavocytochrome c [Candidatus Korobacteraceae bacterium]